MTARPRDLPDYTAPPVAEVAIGVQFNSLDRLMAPHLGLVWAEFKTRFPHIEEHPPIDPVFETFAEKGSAPPIPRIQIQFMTGPQCPRVFFISTDKRELLQVQRDRFLHNWRKMEESDIYPRFEPLLETFEAGYRKLDALIARENLGSIIPNQCELTYINQIPLPMGRSPFEAFQRLFGEFTATLILEDLGKPEDARFMLRYQFRDEESKPIGRLIVTVEPAWKLDGTHLVQMTLVARGKPASPDLDGVSRFLNLGRRHIVRAFTDLTTDDMHKLCGRTQ